VRGPEDRGRARERCPIGGLGDAEVDDPRLAVPTDEHVVRLQVAVHETARVCRLEAARDALGHRERLVLGEGAPAPDEILQRVAADELHHDVVVVAVLAEVVDRRDIRVLDRRGVTRLPPETGRERGIAVDRT
jgi:hypothetical protein